MKLINKYDNNGEIFYTVELTDDVFVDVKQVDRLLYVMQCEDGYEAYNSDGNTFGYYFDEKEVVEFVKGELR